MLLSWCRYDKNISVETLTAPEVVDVEDDGVQFGLFPGAGGQQFELAGHISSDRQRLIQASCFCWSRGTETTMFLVRHLLLQKSWTLKTMASSLACCQGSVGRSMNWLAT
ncbi:uncharacterized protein LOC125236893 isoform X2 [Leguminivora glycinivorella]|uniref:uncharacterized protein LOC125236893 isoform X1 n=1 Tax=Leguminivora glycinivorella TaxID=1035111 RepID=UPI0020106CE4|nr:uncharacterized protein LOC125236893 isoform X1 [Leguminivora glycinivorella]XP_047999776.1 uncharacterized protein LOC125236893 isoform X2 [Leguminivora glycinivorella]